MSIPQTSPRRYQLYPAQWNFVADPTRFTGFIGGIGSGKSFAGALKAMHGPFRRPRRTLGMVLAPTYRMLEDSTWRTALVVWEPAIVDVNRSTKVITLRGGHEVIFRTADDPDKLRGPNLHWFWIDEGAGCGPGVWPVMIGRLRADGEAGLGWVTTTPKGFNWVYDLVVSGQIQMHHASTGDNVFISPEFIASLRLQYGSEFARQELEGEFITLGAGIIHREWFEVLPDAPAGLRWSRYWDLAASSKATADYTASLRVAERDGTLYLHAPIRDRWEWPDARRVILQTMASEPDTETVGIESVAFQLAAVQEIQRAPEALRTAVRGISVDRDKMSRALPWIAKAEAGLVKLCGPGWSAFLDEAANFPEGLHDDLVDACSGAVAMVAAYSPHGGIFV